MTWKSWLSCVSLSAVVAVACSGDDGKKVSQEGEAGAGGESTDPGAGGSSMAPAGAGESAGGTPSGGTPSGGTGQAGEPGVPNEAGAGGAPAGEGGTGGEPFGPITIQDLEGTWTGHALNSYVCESGVNAIELTIDGASVTGEGWGTGQLVQQAEQSFTFNLVDDNPNFSQNQLVQLYVDDTANYAIFIALPQYGGDDGVGTSANIAILQKADAQPLAATLEDFLGDWSGVGFRLGDDFEITEQFASSANFDVDDGLVLSSLNDADGEISSVSVEENYPGEGAWAAYDMTQSPHELGGLFLMSDDKRMMAVALLRKLDPNDSALCDLTDPFVDMSVHKFAFWSKIVD